MDTGPLVTLKGIVVAADWETNGKVSAVDIAGYDEKRYRVADELMGPRLLNLVKERIIAQGTVVSENQRNVIYVHRFRLDDKETVLAVV
ncbi:hypothetical protein DSCW_30070 [Desulfosarcina widdelii]|uniref:Uncharacterized protein n=1 Tax=Desulfosarcina widdelii TaxID=947919 RepID=A0A5K7Z4H5_9BACT|nr:hypothetical protein [Desulfosarcina widdelii]BBO75590.1 hypothetical protein DSCW_30070 [Desulfosarcina widdelii]